MVVTKYHQNKDLKNNIYIIDLGTLLHDRVFVKKTVAAKLKNSLEVMWVILVCTEVVKVPFF